MEENLNFSLEQEPVAEEPVAPKKKKGKLIIGAIAVVLCVAAAICGIVLKAYLSNSPLEKTVNAVFPSAKLWGELMTEGGTLTVEGEIANDLLDSELQEPICFSADYAFSLDSMLFELTAGTKDDRVDIGVLMDKEGMQAYSDRLLGDKVYSVWFDGLMEAIDASPFAPDSGTDYALSQDIYDMIEEYIDLSERETQTFEETVKVFVKATEAMLAKAQITEQKETVSLVGGDTQADVTTYVFGADAIRAFYQTLADEWENNDAFRDEIKAVDANGTITSFIDSVFEELEMRDASLFEADFELSAKYAVKDGYWVYADVLISETTVFGPSSTLFEIRFTEKPQKDPSYEIRCSTALDGVETEQWKMAYRKHDDGKKETLTLVLPDDANYEFAAEYGKKKAFSVQISKRENADSEPDGIIRLSGKLDKKDDLFDLTLDSIAVEDGGGETQFEMKDSSFRLRIESGTPKIKHRKNSTDVLRLSETELDELGATLEGALIDALESIGGKLGTELVYDSYMPNALSRVKVEHTLIDCAYDRTNGHLFLVYDCGTSEEIWMYDATTMELLDTLKLNGPVLAIDADGGYLAFVYETRGQQVAYVHSSEDMTFTKKFDYTDWDDYDLYMQYPGDVLVDGDKLIYVSGDQHVNLYFTDIKTGETIKSPWGFYEGRLSIDRENHVLAALENHLSACDLLFYSTESFELIKEIDRFGDTAYLDGPAYFDGEAFWVAAETWYTPDGNFGELKTALNFATQGTLAQVVYRDENFVATLELDANGEFCTAFYRPDGTFCGSTSELYVWVQKTDDGHYLVAYADGDDTMFAYCELVEGKNIR